MAKHLSIGALLEVELSKKYTPWLREAPFVKSKVSKHVGLGEFLEVEMSKKVHAVVARSAF